MRLPLFASMLLLLNACPGGGGETTATTASSTTQDTQGTTEPGTTGTTASTGTTATTQPTTSGQSASESDSGTTSTSTATSSSSTGPATSTDGTTTTGPATSTTSTGPDTTSTTGDVPADCEPADGDYGDCQTPLGWAWDGQECTARSGCDCGPDCNKFFPDAASCALTCAAAGNCNEDRLEADALAMDPVMQGNLCDGVYVCPADADLKQILEAIFGMLSCEPPGFPCGNGESCTGIFQTMITPEDWLKMCAATLVPGAGDVHCVVFGP